MNRTRAFLGIALPEATRRWLYQHYRAHPGSKGQRAIRPENYHITLVFLGNCTGDQLASLSHTLVAGQPPFTLRLSTIGPFPGTPARLLAALFEPCDGIGNLVDELTRSLEPLGFRPEERRFHPHVTLGKNRRPSAMEAIPLDLEDDQGQFEVNSFALYKSELTPGGSIYTPLKIFPLPPRSPGRSQ